MKLTRAREAKINWLIRYWIDTIRAEPIATSWTLAQILEYGFEGYSTWTTERLNKEIKLRQKHKEIG
jgi:hypothetical protein